LAIGAKSWALSSAIVSPEKGERSIDSAADRMPADERYGCGPDPFLGRCEELAVLRAHFAGAVDGRGSIVLIGGEPGIGKTRLAEEAAAQASVTDVTVAWGRCWEGEGAPAFWPWTQVLRSSCFQGEANLRRLRPTEISSVLRALGVSLPDTPAMESQQSRFSFFDTTCGLLQDAAKNRPLLIILDDLHWADSASLMLLQFLASEVGAAPILIVGTYRDAEAGGVSPLSQLLAKISRHRWIRRVSLRGFSNYEVGEFIERAVGVRPTDHVANLFRERTGGNPFFLTETVRLLGEQGCITANYHQGVLSQLPDTVREAVQCRLKSIPDRSVHTLRYASIVGKEFDVHLVAVLVGQEPEAVREAIELCVDARLVSPLRDSAGSYRFEHALVRECLYQQVSGTDREYQHAQLGAALERRIDADNAAHVAAIAYHYAMGGAAVNPAKALEYSIQAGTYAAAALAFEDAVGHYSRALACRGARLASGRERCELLLSLGEAQRRSGLWDESQGSFRKAACLARGISNSSTLLARAAIGFCGFIAQAPVDRDAVALLREALSALRSDEAQTRVRLLSALTFALHFEPDPVARIDLSAEATAIAGCLGEPAPLSEALEARMNALIGRCDPSELERLARESVELAQRCGDPGREFRCRLFSHLALMQKGQSGVADAELRRCAAIAKTLRYPKYLWQLIVIEAARCVSRGNFDVAQQRIAEAQQLGRYVDGALAEQYRIIQQTYMLYARGEMAACESALRDVVDLYPEIALAHAALANACSASGNLDSAREALEWFEVTELDGGSGFLRFFTLALTAEAASAVQDRVRAQTLYELLQPHANENVVISWGAGVLGSVSHYLALLAVSLGDFDRATGHFEDALAMNARLRAPGLVAVTQRRYCEMLLKRDRRRDRPRATDLLKQAVATFEALQMAGHLRAVRETLTNTLSMTASALTSTDALGLTSGAPGAVAIGPEDAGYIFRREGDLWTIVFEGRLVRVRHARGLAIMAALLAQPYEELHVLDLIGTVHCAPSPDSTGRRRRRMERSRTTVAALSADLGPLLDKRAREEYRKRAVELQSELTEAERFNDLGRMTALRSEIDLLVTELKRAYGRYGRPRLVGAVTERARVNIRNNLTTALNILKRFDQGLWRHLDGALRTGTFCSYRPERPVPWTA
jgi:tetratricopeptide (TPR) repeat protein